MLAMIDGIGSSEVAAAVVTAMFLMYLTKRDAKFCDAVNNLAIAIRSLRRSHDLWEDDEDKDDGKPHW